VKEKRRKRKDEKKMKSKDLYICKKGKNKGTNCAGGVNNGAYCKRGQFRIFQG
jgi:hypothetical protein